MIKLTAYSHILERENRVIGIWERREKRNKIG